MIFFPIMYISHNPQRLTDGCFRRCSYASHLTSSGLDNQKPQVNKSARSRIKSHGNPVCSIDGATSERHERGRPGRSHSHRPGGGEGSSGMRLLPVASADGGALRDLLRNAVTVVASTDCNRKKHVSGVSGPNTAAAWTPVP
jgi:hypothetical protein